MEPSKFITGAEAGLSGDTQIKIALREIMKKGGIAQIDQLYPALEKHMGGAHLSDQGKASFRFFINRVAVQAGYIYPFDKANPGWRITPEGKEFSQADDSPVEEVVDVNTQQSIQSPSNAAKGAAFELYILEILKKVYPNHTWYHQGIHKHSERGLDLLGNLVGNNANNPQVIGVQVKFHAPNTAPTQMEWLKFLAGCFARSIDKAIFITTGRLTGEQRREGGEAKVLVIEGRDEIDRLAKLNNSPLFDLYDEF